MSDEDHPRMHTVSGDVVGAKSNHIHATYKLDMSKHRLGPALPQMFLHFTPDWPKG